MTQALTIAIGGATGFVGSQLVAHLSAQYPQARVRALTRNPESDTARRLAALPGVTVIQGDYGDRRSPEPSMSSPSSVPQTLTY